jgi:predicted nucleic acid-binding protein
VRCGVDTNVLIYAHIPAFQEHSQVWNFLLDQLNRPDVTLVVTPEIFHEFVHVVTDSKRFDPPVSMSEALSIVRLYLEKTNIECLGTTEAILGEALSLMERYKLGRKRVADTLFAATLLHDRINTIVTYNPKDFRVFEGLTVIDPREDLQNT